MKIKSLSKNVVEAKILVKAFIDQNILKPYYQNTYLYTNAQKVGAQDIYNFSDINVCYVYMRDCMKSFAFLEITLTRKIFVRSDNVPTKN
jgi:hypothetical protein